MAWPGLAATKAVSQPEQWYQGRTNDRFRIATVSLNDVLMNYLIIVCFSVARSHVAPMASSCSAVLQSIVCSAKSRDLSDSFARTVIQKSRLVDVRCLFSFAKGRTTIFYPTSKSYINSIQRLPHNLSPPFSKNLLLRLLSRCPLSFLRRHFPAFVRPHLYSDISYTARIGAKLDCNLFACATISNPLLVASA